MYAWDTAEHIRIGWIGVVIGYSEWYWIKPHDAAAMAGVSLRMLRYWSDHALISSWADGPHHERRYMRPELSILQDIAVNRPVTTKLLREIISTEFGR